MNTTVIIPVWNGRLYLGACLDALLAQSSDAEPEIIAVDNASSDGSAEYIAAHFPSVRLVRNRTNQGFAGGCNRGIEVAAGEVIVLLNQDTEVHPGWLAALHRAVNQPGVGAVGCKILYPNGVTIQHAGAWLEWPLGLAHHYGSGEPDCGQWDEPRQLEFVTGAAMAIRREVLHTVGLLDERFWPGYFEDSDLCLRIRQAGYTIRYAPEAVLRHQESTSIRNTALRSYYYHCGRLRLLIKHMSPDRWLQEFVPVEADNVPKFVRDQEDFSLQLAYSMMIMTVPALLVDVWRSDEQEITQIVEALRRLYDMAIAEMVRVHAERLAATTPQWHALVDATAMTSPPPRALPLAEIAFKSNVRWIGPAIVAIRRLWYNMAARWGDHYLRLQQDRINAGFSSELALLRQQIDLLLDENARMRAAIARLQQEHTQNQIANE